MQKPRKIRGFRQHQKRIGKALGIPEPKVAGSNPAGDVQEPQGFDSNPCGFFCWASLQLSICRDEFRKWVDLPYGTSLSNKRRSMK
jgi:hypothetical protein